MKAIVTGANGFIGSALVKKLVSENIEVLALDISFANSRLPKNDLITVKEISVEQLISSENLIDTGKYDTFYHFAWIGLTGELRSDESAQMQNVINTTNCLRYAAKVGCRRFVCAGSIMEYEALYAVYIQNTKPGVSYNYGLCKSLAHGLCKTLAQELGIELVWTYITNAYGEGEISNRLISATLRKIVKGEPIQFTAGIQNYDFIYIDDVAEAFYLIGKNGKANCGYMIGSGKAKPLKQFILDLCNAVDTEVNPEFGKIPYTGVALPLEVFDTSDLKKDCGFTAKVGFADGIRRTMRWLRSKKTGDII